MPNNKERPLNKKKTIVEEERELKEKAKEIANNFVHTKPIKYLIKK